MRHAGDSRDQDKRERLYGLLPAFLRYRDQSEPLESPLRALMAVLERQYVALERDIGQLYDDWFIETCDDWIAPYLGDLLGVRGLEKPESWLPGQRTRIANALTYRRLKGTPRVLERVARDVTGWACVASPFFDRLSVHQALQHVRTDRGKTLDVRDQRALARFGGAFDRVARRPQISGRSGLQPAHTTSDGYNIPCLGLYFWRLRSYPVQRRTARKIAPGCYTFHPLGIDQPLFRGGRSSANLTDPILEGDVPAALDRATLGERLEALRRADGSGDGLVGEPPAFEILDPRSGSPIPWEAIEIADLGQWKRPAAGAGWLLSSGRARTLVRTQVAVDPERGRFAFAEDAPVAAEVLVNHHYAMAGDLGGGPYPRDQRQPSAAQEAASSTGEDTDRRAATDSGPQARFRSLQQALSAMPENADPAVVRIVDSATYGGWGFDLEIQVPAGGSIELSAAPGESPSLLCNLRVVLSPSPKTSRLTLNGLQIGGNLLVETQGSAARNEGYRCQLELRHCTLTTPDVAKPGGKPPQGRIELDAQSDNGCDLTLRSVASILGPVSIPVGRGQLKAFDSVIDGGTGDAIAGALEPIEPGTDTRTSRYGCSTHLERCTLFGQVSVGRLNSVDTIFCDRVTVAAGMPARVRHCYVPTDSELRGLEKSQPSDNERVEPVFVSRILGQPGYAQLHDCCPKEIKTGASGGSEMGVFCSLGNPFREANLASILDEYMPWGLEPRIFHLT